MKCKHCGKPFKVTTIVYMDGKEHDIINPDCNCHTKMIWDKTKQVLDTDCECPTEIQEAHAIIKRHMFEIERLNKLLDEVNIFAVENKGHMVSSRMCDLLDILNRRNI